MKRSMLVSTAKEAAKRHGGGTAHTAAHNAPRSPSTPASPRTCGDARGRAPGGCGGGGGRDEGATLASHRQIMSLVTDRFCPLAQTDFVPSRSLSQSIPSHTRLGADAAVALCGSVRAGPDADRDTAAERRVMSASDSECAENLKRLGPRGSQSAAPVHALRPREVLRGLPDIPPDSRS